MKNKEKQDGITLIALLITIIILIILAAVTIISINDSNLIAQAQSARDKYKEKQEEEIDTIKKSEDYIKIYASDCKHENWEYTGKYVDKENDTDKHWIEKECKECGQKIYNEDEGHFFISYDHGCDLCGGEPNRNSKN